MNKLKVLFMGTPDFSVPCLDMLTRREDIEVVGVVTQPDRQKGRGYQMLPPPVKVMATEKGIEVYQPETLKDGTFIEYLKNKCPELIIVIAYGRILPPDVIDFPRYGCINVHASLLPKYRGAAPIQRCIIEGETKTGVTVMQMDEGLDTGDMLLKKEVDIDCEDTAGTLFDKLAETGSYVLSDTIDKIISGTLSPEKQDHDKMTYAGMISKEFSYIDWNKNAVDVRNLIRGLNPSPGAKAVIEGKIYKIYRAEVSDKCQSEAGTVVESQKELIIACGEGTSLKILSIQPEGKKVQEVSEFLKGHKFEKGLNIRR